MAILPKIRRKNDAPEYGFGTTSNSAGQRILNPDGTANIVRVGEPKFNFINIYHNLITITWGKFNLMVFAFYFIFNLSFALMYYLIVPDGIGGMQFNNETGRFVEIFFFSAQSLTTVGYGRLYPTGEICSSIAAIESMFGLLGFALATGLLYGRFSRPTAKLLYSKNILISPYNHPNYIDKADTALMFRIANARNNQLIEIEAQLLFSYNEESNGKISRRFQRLKLEVDKINFLAMTWTIVHPIDADSPLKEINLLDLDKVDAEFLISIKAIDDTYVQQIYARSSYKWQDLIVGARFLSTISTAEDGRTAIDLRKLDNYEKI
jgi:inward rectifier potassium channel